MTFREAKNYKLTFSEYEGRTIDQTAISDEGLKFLDSLRCSGTSKGKLKTALETYLSDPTITRELNNILQRERVSVRTTDDEA